MPTHAGRELPRVSVDATTIYLNAAQVRTRYGGMSDMALWRWLQDETLGFPKPLVINNRRFWLGVMCCQSPSMIYTYPLQDLLERL